ncbi:ABC transporter ATP-binding protein [Paucibacter soli]|uniref:ABC transporter ATP-binding protein n=1 Tax=Paucibacter soli TaxID=3133433 RepID=UPI0030AD7B19
MPADLPLIQAENLGFMLGDRPLLEGLCFALRPGLSLVRGGDGRGKTTLLRLLAGQLAPTSGRLARQGGASGSFYDDITDPRHDAEIARAWLAARRDAFAASWQAGTEAALVAALQLAEHLDKPLYMLSTGSRRKLNLLAAAASGAALTLLDTPYAALDGRSIRVLNELLSEAAVDGVRAWVLADYALPAGLAGVALAAQIDLGA